MGSARRSRGAGRMSSSMSNRSDNLPFGGLAIASCAPWPGGTERAGCEVAMRAGLTSVAHKLLAGEARASACLRLSLLAFAAWRLAVARLIVALLPLREQRVAQQIRPAPGWLTNLPGVKKTIIARLNLPFAISYDFPM